MKVPGQLLPSHPTGCVPQAVPSREQLHSAGLLRYLGSVLHLAPILDNCTELLQTVQSEQAEP
jgi:hypothetical protein